MMSERYNSFVCPVTRLLVMTKSFHFVCKIHCCAVIWSAHKRFCQSSREPDPHKRNVQTSDVQKWSSVFTEMSIIHDISAEVCELTWQHQSAIDQDRQCTGPAMMFWSLVFCQLQCIPTVPAASSELSKTTPPFWSCSFSSLHHLQCSSESPTTLPEFRWHLCNSQSTAQQKRWSHEICWTAEMQTSATLKRNRMKGWMN